MSVSASTWPEYIADKENVTSGETYDKVLAFFVSIAPTPKEAKGMDPREVAKKAAITLELLAQAMINRVMAEVEEETQIEREVKKAKKIAEATLETQIQREVVKAKKIAEATTLATGANGSASPGTPSAATRLWGASPGLHSSPGLPWFSQISAQEEQAMLDMMGNEANALAVARSLGAATKVDVQAKLTAVFMDGLQFGLQPPVSLVQTLAADKEAADRESPKRLSFVYVNFLTKAMLPLWLTVASVGAKTQTSTSLGAASMQKTMVDFGREVMKATTGRPFFRNLEHWVVVCWKWAVAAIAVETWSLVAQLAYIDTICHIAARESQRKGMEKLGHLVALFYEEKQREQWAERARAGDPTLEKLSQLEVEAAKINESLLEAAKTQFTPMLETCEGFQEIMEPSAPSGGSGSVSDTISSALEHQTSVLDQLNKNQSLASKQLVENQTDLQRRTAALESNGGWQPKTRSPGQQARSQKFFAELQAGERPSQKKGGKSNGGNKGGRQFNNGQKVWNNWNGKNQHYDWKTQGWESQPC